MKKIALFFSALLFSMMSFAGVVTFDADNDKGNAGTDSNNAAAYTITKSGVTVEVSSGILGTYNNETHYRVYKNQTLTITSTVGNITSVEFTCTANGDAKYGPGCFTASTGDYTNDGGAVGTWTGSATEIVFTAASNQVRATQVVVTIDGEVGTDTPEQPETPETPETPEGVITCAEALAICQATGETSTTETYTIRGYVTEIKTAYSEQYGNISLWLADTPDGGKVLQAFRVKPVNATDINVAAGDFVEVVGTLVNYMGNTPEVNAGGSYTIITAGEGGETPEQPEEPEIPEDPENPETPASAIVFDADVDQGNAGTDSNNAAAYTITKSGVTVEVSSGILGTYNNETHYRVYKNQTLTITSTVGNITSVEFTCTANDDVKYGPGCLTADGGDYTYSGPKGTWTGSAEEVVFTAATNQVRATQIVVTVNGEGGTDTPDSPENPEDPEQPDTPQTGTTISDLNYADAFYVEDAEYGDYWVFDLYNDYDYEADEYIYPELYVMVNEAYSKTALNGTYNVLYTDYLTSADDVIATDENTEDFVGTLTIKNVDNEGNYSFKGSFTAADGKTYTYDQVVNVYAYAYSEVDGEPMYEDIELNESGTTPENPDPENPENPETPAGEVTFDADVDKGNAGTDSNNAAAYTITKSGVTVEVSSGILGTYNNETHYRVYKNQTLTVTSTVGNITSVEFTCTADDDAKYGPGCFTVSKGDYAYAGPVGTWTGSASEVVFTATTNQVRATQIVVKIAGAATDVEDIITVELPVKVLNNGQLMIISGENMYNILGTQIK